MKIVTLNKVKNWVKQNPITTFKPKTTTEAAATEKPKEKKPDDHQTPTIQPLLQKLLTKAESSAQMAEISKKRWQLISLVLTMLLAAILYTAIWVHIELNGLTEKQGKLNMEKHALTEKLYTANLEITDLKRQLDLLQSQNAQLTTKNKNLKTQNSLLSSKANLRSQSTNAPLPKYAKDQPPALDKKQDRAKPKQLDHKRLTDIQSGLYPDDMTKAELIAVLGQPDRVYKTELYEQLVYFDHSPSRFWFKNSPYLHASD